MKTCQHTNKSWSLLVQNRGRAKKGARTEGTKSAFVFLKKIWQGPACLKFEQRGIFLNDQGRNRISIETKE